jgi:ADP-heptose:LPS heptosyltransferase
MNNGKTFQEEEWLKAIKKLHSRMARLRLSNEDEEIIKQIANKL